MKQLKPRVVRDFRGQDYVQTSNVCGNTTYVRNYQVEYLLSLAPEHVNKLLTSLSENVQLDRYLHREQAGQSLANIASTCAYSAIWYGLLMEVRYAMFLKNQLFSLASCKGQRIVIRITFAY